VQVFKYYPGAAVSDAYRREEVNVDQERVAQARGRLVDDDVAGDLAEVFGALSDPTRVRLISALSEMELCVGEVAAALGMTLSAVSHQLRLLRILGLVKSRREGRHVYYSLDDEHVVMMYRCGLDHIQHS
jgi:DNA-binding transcriptional ArsR family regulator